jgi:hypothetical protein
VNCDSAGSKGIMLGVARASLSHDYSFLQK